VRQKTTTRQTALVSFDPKNKEDPLATDDFRNTLPYSDFQGNVKPA
jgi:hypothetical protein